MPVTGQGYHRNVESWTTKSRQNQKPSSFIKRNTSSATYTGELWVKNKFQLTTSFFTLYFSLIVFVWLWNEHFIQQYNCISHSHFVLFTLTNLWNTFSFWSRLDFTQRLIIITSKWSDFLFTYPPTGKLILDMEKKPCQYFILFYSNFTAPSLISIVQSKASPRAVTDCHPSPGGRNCTLQLPNDAPVFWTKKPMPWPIT